MRLIFAFILLATSAHAGIIRQNVRHFSKSGDTPLIGDVTISEGTGITLTQIGQNIAISASGSSSAAAEAFRTVTTDYSIATSDYNIVADASNGAVSLTAYTASGNAGRVFCVKKPANDTTNNAVTVAATSRIDGDGTFIMTQPRSAYCFKTNGSTFYVF